MICSAKRLRLYSIAFISHLFVVVDLVELADAGEDIVHALERLLDGPDFEDICIHYCSNKPDLA